MPSGDTEILDKKLSVSTGYRVRQGTVNVSMRVENKGMEDLHNVLISPWLPPSFIAASIPKIRHLPSGGTAHIRMPIAIDFGQGRSMMVWYFIQFEYVAMHIELKYAINMIY